jgi:hypothetical protein
MAVYDASRNVEGPPSAVSFRDPAQPCDRNAILMLESQGPSHAKVPDHVLLADFPLQWKICESYMGLNTPEHKFFVSTRGYSRTPD